MNDKCTKEVLSMLDSTMEQAVPIPQKLFEHCDEIRKLAEENRKRDLLEVASKAYAQAKKDGKITTLDTPARNKDEVAFARPVDITLEEAFNIAFERYEDTLEELAKK